VVSQVKLIAEPWDVGEGGYQVGNFPVLWTEWNGKYRDLVRRFWKGDGGTVSEFASRLAGSSDLYEQSGRRPYASINFITAHDGFTLADLVSYEHKRNEANGEGNADGENHNLSWNCGVEGPTADRRVIELRERQRRNLMATLLLSVGVPMISGGDEMGRTQGGNNNAYCQDNEVSWTNWELSRADADFLEFTRRVIRIWKDHPVLRRRKFFQGRRIRGADVQDIAWLDASGREMRDEVWSSPDVRHLGVRLNGDAIFELNERGERIVGDTLLLLFNADKNSTAFALPETAPEERWETLVDTADQWLVSKRLRAGDRYQLHGRSMAVLRLNFRNEDRRRSGEWGPMGVY
jgi:glycogen operon protein